MYRVGAHASGIYPSLCMNFHVNLLQVRACRGDQKNLTSFIDFRYLFRGFPLQYSSRKVAPRPSPVRLAEAIPKEVPNIGAETRVEPPPSSVQRPEQLLSELETITMPGFPHRMTLSHPRSTLGWHPALFEVAGTLARLIPCSLSNTAVFLLQPPASTIITTVAVSRLLFITTSNTGLGASTPARNHWEIVFGGGYGDPGAVLPGWSLGRGDGILRGKRDLISRRLSQSG